MRAPAPPGAVVEPGSKGRVQSAIVANLPVITISYATGGLNGDLMQAFAVDAVGISPAVLGLTYGLMLLSVPVQFGSIAIVERVGFRRTMIVGYCALLGLMAVLAMAPGAWNPTLVFVVAVVLIEVVVSSSWGLAWHPWMQQVIPRPQRPRYLANAQASAQGFNLVMLATFAAIAGSVVSGAEYQAFLTILGVFVLVSIVAFRRLPEVAGPPAEADGARPGGFGASVAAGYRRLWAGVRAARALPNMRRLLFAYVIDIFMATPLLAGYALVVVGVPASLLAVAIGARSLCGVLLGPFWGRLLTRWGFRRTVAVSVLAGAAAKLLWLFLPADTGHGASAGTQVTFVVVALAGAALGVGYGLAMQFLWYELTPESESVALFTLKDVLESAKAQLGMAVAGVLVTAATASTLSVGVVSVDPYKLAVLGGIPVAVVVLRTLRRIETPEAAHA